MATQTVDGLVTNADEFDWTEMPSQWDGYTSWDGFGDTIGGTGISTTLTFLTAAQDLGAIKNVIPIASCTTNTTTAHTFTFVISDTGVFGGEESTVSAGVLTTRYIKTKIVVTNTSARPGFTTFISGFVEDVINESLFNQDTSGYAGSSASRTIPISKSFSKILLVQGAQSQSETDSTYAVMCTDYSNTAPKLKVVDLDTFGKVAADATIDILVNGLPSITTESTGDIVLT